MDNKNFYELSFEHLEILLKREQALNASLNRYIDILENKADFQNEIRRSLLEKIKSLELLLEKRR